MWEPAPGGASWWRSMGEWRAHVRVRSGDLQVARGRGAGTSRNNPAIMGTLKRV